METERETVFVAFSTQKGGIGKTALTVLTASYLHYVMGINVAVVDCDYPQLSIAKMRDRDKNLVMQDDHYKKLAQEQFKRLDKGAYPIVNSSPQSAITSAQDLLKELDGTALEPHVVFFDLPGTINSEGVLQTLSVMDYIFAPISADRVVLESTLKFAVAINENIITVGRGSIKGLYLLWNMVDKRENRDLYNAYENIIAELGLQLLKTTIPDTKRFRKELTTAHRHIFRSTLFPAHRSLIKGSNVNYLSEEIYKIINNQ